MIVLIFLVIVPFQLLLCLDLLDSFLIQLELVLNQLAFFQVFLANDLFLQFLQTNLLLMLFPFLFLFLFPFPFLFHVHDMMANVLMFCHHFLAFQSAHEVCHFLKRNVHFQFLVFPIHFVISKFHLIFCLVQHVLCPVQTGNFLI